MSDWLDKFKQKASIPQESNDLEEEIRPDNALDAYDEDFQEREDSSMELETFDMDLDEIVADISKTNGYIFASLKAMNEELKAGFTLVRSEMNQRVTNMDLRIDALEEKLTRSLLAMVDGNEKRALLLANALEEINDLVADPDGMTDIFKVAPDIAMGAIEREAQGELSDVKPFNPDDEIYLPEATPDELTMEEEWASQNKIAAIVEEEHPELLTGEYEGGAGEIQVFELPKALEKKGYSVQDYNVVMDYINGDTKWKDIVKYAGGMKQAKALVDPVKASLEML